MKRFRDREAGGGGGYSDTYSEECAHPEKMCNDGRSRPVREAEQGGESMPISRPAPYPTGGRSEPGQRY